MAIREEARPVLEDMEEIKKSPAGMLIRLEDKVDALEMKMDQRFEAVDQRFEAVDRRFEAVNQRIDDLKEYITHRFTVVQWALALLLSSQLIILGKLFVLK